MNSVIRSTEALLSALYSATSQRAKHVILLANEDPDALCGAFLLSRMLVERFMLDVHVSGVQGYAGLDVVTRSGVVTKDSVVILLNLGSRCHVRHWIDPSIEVFVIDGARPFSPKYNSLDDSKVHLIVNAEDRCLWQQDVGEFTSAWPSCLAIWSLESELGVDQPGSAFVLCTALAYQLLFGQLTLTDYTRHLRDVKEALRDRPSAEFELVDDAFLEPLFWSLSVEKLLMASIFRKTEKKSPFMSITADLQLDRAEQQEPLFMLEKSKRLALQSRIVQLIRGETIPEVWSRSSAPVMRRRLKQTCLPPYISSADMAFLIMSSIVQSDQRRQPSTRPVLQLLAWFAETDKQLFTASHHATRDRNANLAKKVSDFADQLKSAVTRRVCTLLHDASARMSSVRFFRQAQCATYWDVDPEPTLGHPLASCMVARKLCEHHWRREMGTEVLLFTHQDSVDVRCTAMKWITHSSSPHQVYGEAMNSWIELIRAGFKDAMEPKMLTNSPLVISLPPVKPSFRSQHKEEVTAPVPGAPEGVDLQSFYRSETQEDPSQKRKRTDDETPHASQSSTPPNDQENVLTRPKRPREGDEHRPAAKRSRSDFDFDLQ